ncbi:hypothetical protein [Algoriphagus hitonicola]|uniref:Uncharacterized protein n=1 Tax=Algoriphagus hitonicola TaxID=435880 RepID=A0A1I2RFS0_9BACT|nr:hypothetical protein [Algoriphagus hitonicola]SFG38349.1 hypothetical protein SAMN04487988_103190 [Algoriphagus hitonicola]
MQETWTFDLQTNDISDAFLSEMLKEKKNELGIFLSYYFKKDGAVAENVGLATQPTFLSETSGWLMLNFDLIYFNACLNIHEQEKEKMKVTFEVDRKTGKLILTGPYWPSREMDEI